MTMATCRGCIKLGTACGKCSKCLEELAANSHCPDPHGSRYAPISNRLAHQSLMLSGLFFEFYPELSGVWHDDKDTILNENKPDRRGDSR